MLQLPIKDSKEKNCYKSIANLFYSSYLRREYTAIIYDPSYQQKLSSDNPDPPNNVLNCYIGMRWTDEEAQDAYFNNPQAKKNMEMLQNHIKEILCNGDEQSFIIIQSFFADKFQHPENKYGKLILFVGPEGCGKSIIINALLMIFGVNADSTESVKDVVGQFNNILDDKLMIFLDEFKLDKNAESRSKIYAAITEKKTRSEKKYGDRKTRRCYINYIAATNLLHSVFLSTFSRRFIIIQSNPTFSKKINSHLAFNYFEKLDEIIESDDNAALKAYFYFLKNLNHKILVEEYQYQKVNFIEQ
jgi:phage/plasmid-associated DNA primase